jgi:hypothetical protein
VERFMAGMRVGLVRSERLTVRRTFGSEGQSPEMVRV